MVGAGIVGLACAEELVRAGHDVRVADPRPGQGATYAAAGMLAPAGEAWHGETALLRLGIASARLWPEYAARLSAGSTSDVGYRRGGTLLVGLDRDDLQHVRRTSDVLRGEGIAFHELGRRDLARHEPALARSAGGALLSEDHSVHPRLVADALVGLLGDRVVRLRVARLDPAQRRVVLADGSVLGCDAVVVATGADAQGWVPGVRPVRGETIRVRTADPPRRVVRARIHGEAVYLVPRAGGEVVVGASEEEHEGAPFATVGTVVRLLAAARVLLPGLDAAELVDVTARNRPGTPDNGPMLGLRDPGAPWRQVLAVGHYRGGVLLAPLTAQVVRAYVEGVDVPEVALPFAPDRFRAAPPFTGAGPQVPTTDRGGTT